METEEPTKKEEALLKLIREAIDLANNSHDAASLAIVLSIASAFVCIACIVCVVFSWFWY